MSTLNGVRVGFCLPQYGPMATERGGAARFAREAEALGASSLWVGDRLLAPVSPVRGYGGSDSMPPEFRVSTDPFALLAAAAASTQEALLGASVLNAPFYPPALLARSLATIDVISGGGRILAGLGSGWSYEEFEAVGVPLRQRGARLEECLDALEHLWGDNPVEHHGRHWHVAASQNDLRPTGTMPVYLGGYAEAALDRVARRADGWLPVAYVDRFDAEALAAQLSGLRAAVRAHGRDPDALDAVLRVNPAAGHTPVQIAAVVAAAQRQAGVDHAFVDLMYLVPDVDAALEYADQVLARVAG